MGIQLEDGTGKGYSVKIDAAHRIRTYSVIEKETHYENEENGNTYIMFIDITPNSPNPSLGETSSIFLYMKNLSEKILCVDNIKFWAESNEYIDIKLDSIGTPTNGTSITPVNLNSGYASTASGTFLKGESITGLSGETFLDRFRIAGDNNNHKYEFIPTIILTKNKTLTFLAGNGGIPLECSIEFYYHTSS